MFSKRRESSRPCFVEESKKKSFPCLPYIKLCLYWGWIWIATLPQKLKRDPKKIFELLHLIPKKSSKSKCAIAFWLHPKRLKGKQGKQTSSKLFWMSVEFLAPRNNFASLTCFTGLCGGSLPVHLPNTDTEVAPGSLSIQGLGGNRTGLPHPRGGYTAGLHQRTSWLWRPGFKMALDKRMQNQLNLKII